MLILTQLRKIKEEIITVFTEIQRNKTERQKVWASLDSIQRIKDEQLQISTTNSQILSEDDFKF